MWVCICVYPYVCVIQVVFCTVVHIRNLLGNIQCSICIRRRRNNWRRPQCRLWLGILLFYNISCCWQFIGHLVTYCRSCVGFLCRWSSATECGKFTATCEYSVSNADRFTICAYHHFISLCCYFRWRLKCFTECWTVLLCLNCSCRSRRHLQRAWWQARPLVRTSAVRTVTTWW